MIGFTPVFIFERYCNRRMLIIEVFFYRQCLKCQIGNTHFVNEPIHIANIAREYHKTAVIRVNRFNAIIDAFTSGFVDHFRPPHTNEYWSRFGFYDGVINMDRERPRYDGRYLNFSAINSHIYNQDLLSYKTDHYTRVPYIDPEKYVKDKDVIRKIVINSSIKGLYFGVYHFNHSNVKKIIRKISKHPLLLADINNNSINIQNDIDPADLCIEEIPFVYGFTRILFGQKMEV